jgi:hypothetical protein
MQGRATAQGAGSRTVRRHMDASIVRIASQCVCSSQHMENSGCKSRMLCAQLQAPAPHRLPHWLVPNSWSQHGLGHDVRCHSLGIMMNSPGPTSHCKPLASPYRGNCCLIASFVISDPGVSARWTGMRAWLSLIVADTTRVRSVETLNSVYLLHR